jgi:hypothetical protein
MRRNLLALSLAAATLTSSCLGPNNAFNNLHHWNKTATDSKWGNEVIFLALNIIPVYGLAYLGDIVIFNSVEFWGGENPIAPHSGT